MTVVELQIDQIRIDGGTQARVSINEAVVAEYAEALTEGAALPPVVVFFDGADHFLVDGFHRFHANRRIGARTLACEVITGTLLEARLYAHGANRGHGLQRTNADKRQAVEGTLALKPEWSDRAIAKHVGVHHQMVATARVSLDESSSERPDERTYTTKHGTKATMNTAGQKKAGKDKAAKGKATKATPISAPAAPAQAEPVPTESDTAACSQAAPDDFANDGDDAATVKSLTEEVQRLLAENTRMGEVFDANDKLATAMQVNDQLTQDLKNATALLATANERINGLLFKEASMSKEMLRLQRQVDRLKKATAEAA